MRKEIRIMKYESYEKLKEKILYKRIKEWDKIENFIGKEVLK